MGYRNVNVLPPTQDHISLWKHVDNGVEGEEDVELELEEKISSNRSVKKNILANIPLSETILEDKNKDLRRFKYLYHKITRNC